MICPFCGKETEDSNGKCQYCGYAFSIEVPSQDKAIIPKPIIYETTSPPVYESLDTRKEIENVSPSPDAIQISATINNESPVPNNTDISPEPEHAMKQSYTKEDYVELVASIIGIVAATISFILWRNNDHFDKIGLTLCIMIVLGAIGLVDTIIYTLLERTPPCTIPGTIFRTAALLLLVDYTNLFSLVVYVIVYAISSYYVVTSYSNKKPAIILGLVSIFLLPFIGVIVAVIGTLFLHEMFNGRKRKK